MFFAWMWFFVCSFTFWTLFVFEADSFLSLSLNSPRLQRSFLSDLWIRHSFTDVVFIYFCCFFGGWCVGRCRFDSQDLWRFVQSNRGVESLGRSFVQDWSQVRSGTNCSRKTNVYCFLSSLFLSVTLFQLPGNLQRESERFTEEEIHSNLQPEGQGASKRRTLRGGWDTKTTL